MSFNGVENRKEKKDSKKARNRAFLLSKYLDYNSLTFANKAAPLRVAIGAFEVAGKGRA